MDKTKLSHGKRGIALVLMVLMLVSCFSVLGTVSAAEGDVALGVTEVLTDASGDIYDNQRLTLSATIRNSDAIDISGATVIFAADGRVVDTVTADIKGNNAVNTVTATKPYSAWFGTHKLKVYVKYNDAIVNSLAQRISVLDELQPLPVIGETPENAAVIINQVYGGGGKADAPVSHDFIELYNTTDQAIDLSTYKINYISNRLEGGDDADIPGSTYGAVASLNLEGTIPANGYFLIRCAAEARTVNTYIISEADMDWERQIDNYQYNITLYADGVAQDSVTAIGEKEANASLVREVEGEGEPVYNIGKTKAIRRIDFADTNSNTADFETIKYSETVPSSKTPKTSSYDPNAKDPNYDEDALTEPATEPATQAYDAYADYSSGTAQRSNENAGYTGSGYVNYLGTATYNVDVEEAGQYELKFRYSTSNNKDSSGKATSTAQVAANGTTYSAEIMQFGNSYPNEHIAPYNSTDTNSGGNYWDSWRWTEAITVNLNAGSNEITFSLSGWDYNLDAFTLEKVEEKTITSFAFLRANNEEALEGKGDIKCEVGNGKITATIPANMDVSKLVATFETAGGAVVKAKASDGAVQESGVSALNYTNGMTLFCDGVEYAVVLNKVKGSDLPSVFIEFDPTDKTVTTDSLNMLLTSTNKDDKDTKVNCTVTLDASSAKLPSNLIGYDETTELNSFDQVSGSTIKLRGNSTIIDAEKKSYTIKLGKKNAALDMGKHKTWVLVGCYDDKTMMRQYMGYQLANYFSQTNGDWSVHQRFAQVWFDGEYLGTYMFGESVKVDKNRVAILDNDETEGEDADGNTIEVNYLTTLTSATDYDRLSFIVEKDNRDTSDPLYISGGGYGWIVTSPEDQLLDGADGADTYKQCISNYLSAALGTFQSGNYWEWIDVESFADFYLVYEIMKTIDAGTGYSSIYLTKDAVIRHDGEASFNDGKLTAGPAWDFNPGSGNANYTAAASYSNDATGYWLKSDRYFWNQLFNNTKTIVGGDYDGKTFREVVIARRDALYNDYLKSIDTQIATLESYLAPAMEDNYDRWDILDTYTWPQPKIFHSYEAEVDYFSNWMVARSNWLKDRGFTS